jgi:hypothetical protein
MQNENVLTIIEREIKKTEMLISKINPTDNKNTKLLILTGKLLAFEFCRNQLKACSKSNNNDI